MDTTETSFFYAVVTSFIVIGIVLFYFFLLLMRQWKHNMELHRQKSIAVTNEIENERTRIANDLHDDILPFLNIIKMKIDHLECSGENELKRKAEIEKYMAEVLGKVREISFDMIPAGLLRNGLVEAISLLAGHVNKKHKINIDLKMEDEFDLRNQDAVHVLRIVQEIVHNAIRHSRATEMTISFSVKKNMLCLIISDNGVGLDYNSALDEGKGLGLKSIRYRVHVLNGQMSVESKKGQGLRYVFEIPLCVEHR